MFMFFRQREKVEFESIEVDSSNAKMPTGLNVSCDEDILNSYFQRFIMTLKFGVS